MALPCQFRRSSGMTYFGKTRDEVGPPLASVGCRIKVSFRRQSDDAIDTTVCFSAFKSAHGQVSAWDSWGKSGKRCGHDMLLAERVIGRDMGTFSFSIVSRSDVVNAVSLTQLRGWSCGLSHTLDFLSQNFATVF